eukprot:gene7299-1304_t
MLDASHKDIEDYLDRGFYHRGQAKGTGETSRRKEFKAIPVSKELLQFIRMCGTHSGPGLQAINTACRARCLGRAEYLFYSGVKPKSVVSTADAEKFPATTLPEVVFAGRSNVGKSSLLNSLTGSGKCPTSSTPGETKALRWLALRHTLHLVDMPGYGFAFACDDIKEKWHLAMSQYLSTRKQVSLVYVLIDARQGLKTSDRELITRLQEAGKRYRVVLTKADLVHEVDLARRITLLADLVNLRAADILPVTSKYGTGVANLANNIALAVFSCNDSVIPINFQYLCTLSPRLNSDLDTPSDPAQSAGAKEFNSPFFQHSRLRHVATTQARARRAGQRQGKKIAVKQAAENPAKPRLRSRHPSQSFEASTKKQDVAALAAQVQKQLTPLHGGHVYRPNARTVTRANAGP